MPSTPGITYARFRLFKLPFQFQSMKIPLSEQQSSSIQDPTNTSCCQACSTFALGYGIASTIPTFSISISSAHPASPLGKALARVA